MKLLEESIGEMLSNIGMGRILEFKSIENRAKLDEWDYVKGKASVQQRKQSTEGRDNQQNGRKCVQTMDLTGS
jgi:hypothetical protein